MFFANICLSLEVILLFLSTCIYILKRPSNSLVNRANCKKSLYAVISMACFKISHVYSLKNKLFRLQRLSYAFKTLFWIYCLPSMGFIFLTFWFTASRRWSLLVKTVWITCNICSKSSQSCISLPLLPSTMISLVAPPGFDWIG